MFCRSITYRDTERLPSDTRRMPRTEWSSPPRWPPGRAACRRTDLVSCHVSCMSLELAMKVPEDFTIKEKLLAISYIRIY